MAVTAGTRLNPSVLDVFPRVEENKQVPNHLIDTKIFATIGENEVIHAQPGTIHFHGFDIGEKYFQKLHIINASSVCQQVHVIPPTHDDFKISYKKQDSLVPGMYLEVTVEFTPKISQYQFDSIRIHCKAVDCLIVPIHAYQVMDTSKFPRDVHFGSVIVGERKTKRIPLKNTTLSDFDFSIGFVQKHSAFKVSPTEGTIPSNSQVDFEIAFSPVEFVTAIAEIQLMISQFNSKPVYCKLTGRSEPGLAKKIKEQEIAVSGIKDSKPFLDPRSLSPLGRLRIKKSPSECKEVSSACESKTVKDGIQFPSNLFSHAAVVSVLTQKPGKMKAKELREAIQAQQQLSQPANKQMKEAVFEALVNKNVSEEEKNPLRWCVHLGEEEFSSDARRKIVTEQDKHYREYAISRGDPQNQFEFDRSVTTKSHRRINRPAGTAADPTAHFDLFLNDSWHVRHAMSRKFVQAARKVIIRARASKRIQHVSKYIDQWRRGMFTSSAARPTDEMDAELQIINSVSIKFHPEKIKPSVFMKFTESDEKNDMTLNGLGTLPCRPIVIHVKEKVEVYELKVPQQYKLLSYHPHPVTSAVTRYVPRGLARPLRTGAEDEVTGLMQSEQVVAETPDNYIGVRGTPTRPPDSISATLSHPIEAENSDIVRLPQEILEPPRYHPMHIFNPCPGLQAQIQDLPYAENTEGYKVCPVPLEGQRGKLDRDDIIPGIMTWKRFPCHALICMSGPELSSFYVPRWSDPFHQGIASFATPALLDSLPADDAAVVCKSSEVGTSCPMVMPTMDSVEAEFNLKAILNPTAATQDGSTSFPTVLPGSNDPTASAWLMTRSQRLSELDVHLRSKLNTTGQRIQTNVEQLLRDWNLNT